MSVDGIKHVPLS